MNQINNLLVLINYNMILRVPHVPNSEFTYTYIYISDEFTHNGSSAQTYTREALSMLETYIHIYIQATAVRFEVSFE